MTLSLAKLLTEGASLSERVEVPVVSADAFDAGSERERLSLAMEVGGSTEVSESTSWVVTEGDCDKVILQETVEVSVSTPGSV